MINRWSILGLLLWAINVSVAAGYDKERGVPFVINYTAEEYQAHDRNEAVVCDRHGNVYFANFEGILRFDGESWQLLTTPGISRITALAVDTAGEVYAGGYNVAGKLENCENGELKFVPYLSDSIGKVCRIGEVCCILQSRGELIYVARQALVWIKNDSVQVIRNDYRYTGGFVTDSCLYCETEEGRILGFSSGKLTVCQERRLTDVTVTAMCDLSEGRKLLGTNRGLYVWSAKKWERIGLKGISEEVSVNDLCITEKDIIIVATATHGVLLINKQLELTNVVNENKGLCSNVINGLAVDYRGSLWVATGEGIARILISSMYSRYTEQTGLTGEVLTMIRYDGQLYVGTYHGLFYLDQEQKEFRKVLGIKRVCWQLTLDLQGNLWASTGDGVFRVTKKKVYQYSNQFTTSVGFHPKNGAYVYTGEQNAVYRYSRKVNDSFDRIPYASIGQVKHFIADSSGNMWMSTVFGEVYKEVEVGSDKVVKALKGLKNPLGNKMMSFRGRVIVIAEDGFYQEVEGDSVSRFTLLKDSVTVGWWPGTGVEDREGKIWLTRGDGKEVKVWQDGVCNLAYQQRLNAIAKYPIRVVYPEDNGVVWFGGSFGLIRLELTQDDPEYSLSPSVYVRKIIVNPEYPRNIGFRYATDAAGIIGPTEYSCRLSGFDQDWEVWQGDAEKEYMHLPYGKYKFEVRTKDVFGKIGVSEGMKFEILPPFYFRWYAYGVYMLMLIMVVLGIIKWRIQKLIQEKERLESIVTKRTEEICIQRDEIREKSESLEQTLQQLNQAQDELVRQEKMATVGKLTQGLVDRILNPLNYIGNFALLSKNLAIEAEKIVEDGKDAIPLDMREDLSEVMEMLSDNLTKISEHGGSTARVLKAMEEILKERKCVLLPMEINKFCQKNLESLKTYFGQIMEEKGIQLHLEKETERLVVLADAGQLSKVLQSILSNGICALLKKLEKTAFIPELEIKLKQQEGTVVIVIRDNGIGIEKEVLNKVFDPFFTTRTTAEAAGIGLYLSREVILNHRGRILITSEQGIGTEVSIELQAVVNN